MQNLLYDVAQFHLVSLSCIVRMDAPVRDQATIRGRLHMYSLVFPDDLVQHLLVLQRSRVPKPQVRHLKLIVGNGRF